MNDVSADSIKISAASGKIMIENIGENQKVSANTIDGIRHIFQDSNDGTMEIPAEAGKICIIVFDGFNTADITAHIANPDGSFREEKVTKAKSTWTLTGNKLPDKAGVLLTFVPKKDIDNNKVYDIGINGGITVTSFRNDGVVDFKSDSENSHMTVKGDKLREYYVGKGVGFARGVSENGKIVSVDVDSFDFGLNGLWEWVAGWLK